MKIEVKDGLGDHQTPGWIESWNPNGGQDGLCNRQVPGLGVRYVRYVRYTPLALGLSAFWGRAPAPPLCFPVFVFSLPPPPFQTLGRALNERLKTLRPTQPHVRFRICARANNR